ncbi:hypothetical protein J7337_000176 [Fusarium musae]|uniref:Uncharacterized protein n=1 Tax=Fusarium musae TaxID=1042133 RepID=A0A9P8DRE8_9HYPO|nr:hypothetical protein J7337_000176 [Fusarium musae]KAG9506643.1 hypothetical protein J7337_000176 [Fusarium musae]
MDASKADIRIDFKQGGGSSSCVGTDALSENNQEKRTMNLDINLRHSEEFIRRKVLHEFGRVLGCEHEHQSPLEDFEWNKDLIYEELSKPPNSWSRAPTDHNVIKRLESSEVSTSSFDADSIMLYEYPARWFKNTVSGGTKSNTRLPERDKKWIANTYLPWSSDIGQFSTLHLDYKTDICVKATAEDVSVDHFTVGITPGTGSNVYSAACSWLEAWFSGLSLGKDSP